MYCIERDGKRLEYNIIYYYIIVYYIGTCCIGCVRFVWRFFFIIYLFIIFFYRPHRLFFSWDDSKHNASILTREWVRVSVCEVVFVVASAYRFCGSDGCVQVRSCKTIAVAAAVGILSEKFIPPTIQATNGRELRSHTHTQERTPNVLYYTNVRVCVCVLLLLYY